MANMTGVTPVASPFLILPTLLQHRYLIGELIKRDVLLRYRGAYFGLLWIFLIPLIMLGVFTFVFSQIFQARWPVQSGDIPFALNLFCGLIAFNIFAETVGRAPAAVRSYPNYVKKIIFPIEILPFVPLGSSLIHGLFSTLILVAALAWTGNLHITFLLFPLLLLPLIMTAIGLTWFLAAWGVFIKDMSMIVPVFLQLLMFLSPIFYPAEAVPEALQPLYILNPLSPVIEALRAAIAHAAINWQLWFVSFAVAFAIMLLGHTFFNRSREEFADAL